MTHSTISLGVGLGGGKSATSSGRLPSGGGAFSNTLSGSFDGTDDNVDCGVLSAYQGASNMSMSFWFKPDSSGHGPSMGSRVAGANQWGFLRAGSTNYIQVVTASNGRYTSFSSPSDTNWHHYVMTFDSGTVKLYIDGSEISVSWTNWGLNSSTVLHSQSASFYLGRNDTFYSDGLVDEVALWTATLDQANITAIYNSGVPASLSSDSGDYDQSSSLTHWWRVGDDSADTSSGGGAAAAGNVIGNVENVANSGTNDGTGSGATYSSTVPS
jgi:hypothetical protein